MISILTGIIRRICLQCRLGHLSMKHFQVKKKTDQWRPLQRKLVLHNTNVSYDENSFHTLIEPVHC